MARTAGARTAPGRDQRPEVRSYLLAVRRSETHPYVTFLGMKTFDTPSLHEKVKRGFSFHAFERFLRLTDLPAQALATILLIPARTLQRRKALGRLEPDESDRLLRLSRIYGKAIELFEGDNKAALEWLRNPIEGLGGAAPLAMCQTEPGAQEVEHLIGRLEHGVFS